MKCAIIINNIVNNKYRNKKLKVLLKSVLVASKQDLKKNDVFVLESVSPPDGLVFPKKGITFFYGFKESVVNISNEIKRAGEKGLEVHPLSVVVNAERNDDATLSLEELPSCTFLNISRLKKDIYEIIRGHLKDFIEKESLVDEMIELEIWDAKINTITTKGILLFIMQHPYVIDYLWEQKEFNHLDVIVYPVLDGIRKSSRATLFKSTNVVKNEYGTAYIELLSHPDKVILLPDNLD